MAFGAETVRLWGVEGETDGYEIPRRNIVSDSPACLEVALPADCYFPCGDINALSDRLAAKIMSPVRRVDYNLAAYDWDAIAEKTMEVYRQLHGQ